MVRISETPNVLLKCPIPVPSIATGRKPDAQSLQWNLIGSPNRYRTLDLLYSCCNRKVAGIQISTVVAPRRCGIHHLFAQTWRVRVNKCRRFAATNTTLRRLDVF